MRGEKGGEGERKKTGKLRWKRAGNVRGKWMRNISEKLNLLFKLPVSGDKCKALEACFTIQIRYSM